MRKRTEQGTTEIDKRGRKTPANKTSAESIMRVKKHIESFPTVESHYCRKDTSRQYLDQALNLKIMYQLYINDVQDQDMLVSEYMYRQIFNNQFNLSFSKPKKDQCDICYKQKGITEGGDDNYYRIHIEHKENALSLTRKSRRTRKKQKLGTYTQLRLIWNKCYKFRTIT